jgi:hypothetical protein
LKTKEVRISIALTQRISVLFGGGICIDVFAQRYLPAPAVVQAAIYGIWNCCLGADFSFLCGRTTMVFGAGLFSGPNSKPRSSQMKAINA